jgi:hypothetical protein
MDIERHDRRSRRLAYASFAVLAVVMHMCIAVLTLAAHTSCAWPPCHDSTAFSVWQALWDIPLFVTPWLRMPVEEIGFAWSLPRVALVVLNSALAVALLAAVGWLVKLGISRSRVSSACSAARGR